METVGLGFYYEDLPVGEAFRIIGRTVTAADITNFVNCPGMVEVLFTDLEFLRTESDINDRVAPAAITYCFTEGLLVCRDDAALRLRLPAHGPVHGVECGEASFSRAIRFTSKLT